jgi:hypothetical protein
MDIKIYMAVIFVNNQSYTFTQISFHQTPCILLHVFAEIGHQMGTVH